AGGYDELVDAAARVVVEVDGAGARHAALESGDRSALQVHGLNGRDGRTADRVAALVASEVECGRAGAREMEDSATVDEHIVAAGGTGALSESPAGLDDELTGRLTDLATGTGVDRTAGGVAEDRKSVV